ncbi:hypothetical protein A8990_1812 [Paenibacillus taihuensis]|uniref:Uncharacterized protein n=1 Tax=Paenibacillus taihuensis TaxID=1156355 RepID=A0A3D9PWV3_9BACL|nr:hypothetical protein [Paenibacillus taihuensis]REE54712.1 hypothetical protein A8990_1812 [Paenibacillus taihuensis]
MELTREELNEFGRQAAEKARSEAQAAGLPFSYGQKGRVFREYPDGRKFEVLRSKRKFSVRGNC